MESDAVGIFPISFVSLVAEGHRDSDSVADANEEVLVRARQALREWGTLMNAWMKGKDEPRVICLVFS